MKTMIGSVLLVAALGLAGTAAAQDVAVSKMAFMTFKGNVTIQASPAAVWSVLTSAEKAHSWCPVWKAGKMAKPLTTVGTTIDYADEYGNTGKSVVLYVDPEKELRVANVPNNGSFVCQTSVQLTPQGNGTLLQVTEQYSDAMDAPVDTDTAAKTKTEMDGYLKSLKNLVEQGATPAKGK